MNSKLRLALSSVALLALTASVQACAGTPIPAPIESEPVCPDIDIGTGHPAKMIGGLTYPVRLRVLDGKNVMMKMILSGKRLPTDPSSHTLLPDDNAEYVLEWAQCDNVRSPRPANAPSKTRRAGKDTTAYDCGDAKIYKTDKLVTKKHDAASHAFSFAAPPKADCWVSDVAAPAPVPPPAPSASAAAPMDTAAPSASASAAPATSAAPAKK